MSNLENYHLAIVPLREPLSRQIRVIHNKAYKLWFEIWSGTLKELDNIDRLFSNEFSRFDFAYLILKGDEVISLMSCTEVDLSLDSRRNDSWFESWPQEILSSEKCWGKKGLVAAWFCTDSRFRKSQDKIDFNISKVMAELFGEVLLDGQFDLGFGVTRNNRNVGKYSENADTHTVETHIYRLRKKMKEIFGDENFIKNEKNGYSIN